MSVIGSSILSVARNALTAHQMAVQTSSHNIANAQTEGYSRQRVMLRPGDPVRMAPHWLGSGVTVESIGRVRDSLLDLSVRRESANAAGFGVRRDLLAQTEAIFNEPTENGLAAGMDAFWSSWADLANDPTNPSARSAVQQRGAQVAATLNGYDARLRELSDGTALRFEASVKELNGLLKEVAALNERITAAEVGRSSAGDLRDARDRAIDGIAKIVDVRVIDRKDGSVGLVIGGNTVVDANQARTLDPTVQREPGTGRVLGLGLSDRGRPLGELGGRVEGLVDAANDIANASRRLDTLAAKLVEHVNAAHQSAGGSAPPFFDPAGTRASTLRLSAAVQGDPAVIRAGSAAIGPTDNSVALRLAGFRGQIDWATDGNGDPVRGSFADFYRDIVSEVAFKTSEADRSATAAETLAEQAETRRQSVSGVSVDEELIGLMRHQQAYTAASKLIKTADEMVQTILGLV